jgi:putative ABC transport system ATP-binding protein
MPPLNKEIVIRLAGLAKSYGSGEGAVHALRPTDLEISSGEYTAIMGPSGSGKSTMLNLLGLLDRPTAGSYFLDGHDVSRLNDDDLSEIRCLKVGFVFQTFNLFTHQTVLENVCVPMRYAEFGHAEMLEHAHELIGLVGLENRASHRPNQLSGGQCQRVAIARALANNPAIILADEPTGNLDEKTGKEILALFEKLRDSGRTIIMVTHNPEYENVVERVVRLHDGQIASDKITGVKRR